MSGSPRFERAVAGINNLARFGGRAVVDLMLFPQHVDEVATEMPALRKLLPEGTRIALGVLYLSGRERGDHLFASRSALEASLDRIAFEGGETIAATAPSPVAERREGCTCALGHHLHVRSDGALFTCFKMEEQVGDLTRTGFAAAVREVQATPHPATTLPFCAGCALATLCGGGCRSENLQYTGDADRPVCDEWRVRVLSELLAEDRATALEWPAPHLLAEARERGIPAPEALVPVVPSRHLIDT
jgi:radical SAM protein with 4Fe4S-binding SPASM domain